MASRRAVLIGGGITGTLCARELLLRGWDVTIAEARHIGAGSSSRTAAGIRQQFSTPGTVRGMRYATRFYERFRDEVEGHEPVIVQNGYLFLHADEPAWQAALERVDVQRAAGLVEVEALSAGALQQRFPWVSPDLVGGTFCPTDGFLHPALIYGEASRRVRELGGTILQNAPVTGAKSQGGRIAALLTPKGELGGDVFLDCTNAWSPRLGAILGAEPLQISPLKRYLWFVQREGSLDRDTFSKMPLVVSPSGVYCRPENEDSLLMGFAHDAPPEPNFDYDDQDRVDPGFAHNSGTDALPFESWAKLADAIPPIAEFGGITATTSGFYATTPDHNPFYGYDPRVTNLIRLVGYSGHGAMLGPFSALVAATLAEAGRDVPSVQVEGGEVDLAAFRIGRVFGHAESMVI